jgi:hypothetical protein
MRKRQPDNRIKRENLGVAIMSGKRFVVNTRPGVPFNACIEEAGGSLRCWASHRWLDDRAALAVVEHATKTETGAFLWNKGVKLGSVACVKGDQRLYKVILP